MKPEQAEYVKRETSVVVVDVGCRSYSSNKRAR